MTSATAGQPHISGLSFDDLPGWASDDHAEAFGTFRNTCAELIASDWRAICSAAETAADPRVFFETLFRPVLIEDGTDALFTGYFEPELKASRHPTEKFRHPIYAMPPEAQAVHKWHSRRDLIEEKKLEGRGLELAWLDDPIELFFLQIQGSGRLELPDGSLMRVGYGGKNGHPYRSIGAELVRRGVFAKQQITAQVIKDWMRRQPDAGAELMFHNPSYVFFREVDDVPPDAGPAGAMNRSVTQMRSLAVDPAFVPLGAPVWIETAGRHPMRRLMVAQDTGSAIKGAQRADIFFGTGDEAGRAAGELKATGRIVVLLPIERANALLSGGGT